jgi:glycosyltransferase involved in cell wall biosynthesis
VSTRGRSALVYSDINLAMIGGSSVWLATMTELLARAGCAVTLQLRGPRLPEMPLLRPLVDDPAIRIVEPPADGETFHPDTRRRLEAAVAALRGLDTPDRFDLVVIRGLPLAARLAQEPEFEGRLWTYLTDVPQSVVHLGPAILADLATIALASQVVLCQTEELRSYLESIVPANVGRTALLPPVVPPLVVDTLPRGDPPDRPIRLVYAGKFAARWNTLEMTRLPGRLAERGVSAELIVLGDKIHPDPRDRTYAHRMKAALRDTPDVVWHGGQSRADAMRLVARGDIGLGWRHEALDASLEMSTKVLEYGVLNLPVVLNRTPMHERLLGQDYPLFASSEDDVVDAIVEAVADPAVRSLAASRARVAAADYTFERGTARLAAILDRAFPAPLRSSSVTRRLRIGVASHDFKFFTGILRHLQSLPDVEVRLDVWPTLRSHDVNASQAMVEWADVVICEWCGPNAVWYSQHKRPGQQLIVRLHRFELDRRWPREVVIDQVDRVVCVSESYGSLTRTVTGWPASKIVVIPNWVDDLSLDRPKLPGARFNLGFIGMAPSRKRLDRALDVLEWLRAGDPRYRLFVKSKLSWDYPSWSRPEERIYADLVMRRLQVSALLRGSVVFHEFGPDVASWLRRVGFVLSTSDDESFHLAPAEGMASGAVPAILDWPGADTIYDPHWVHRSTDDMARSIASVVEEDRWDVERDLARTQVRSAFGLARVSDAWSQMIRGIEADAADDRAGAA